MCSFILIYKIQFIFYLKKPIKLNQMIIRDSIFVLFLPFFKYYDVFDAIYAIIVIGIMKVI